MIYIFKRFFFVIVLFFVSVTAVFAVEETKRITAFKQDISGGFPTKSVSIRCLSMANQDISSGNTVVFDDLYRKASGSTDGGNILGFSWICSGNVFSSVTVTFAFGPMTHKDTNKNSLIYYSVDMSHSSTRIGNATVLSNGNSPNDGASLRKKYLTTNYSIIYADSVSFDHSSVDVKENTQTVVVTYNLATKSRIFLKDKSGTYKEQLYNSKPYPNGFINDCDNTCEYWNRYGEALFTLDVTPKNEGGNTVYYTNGGYLKCDEGWYNANVTITLASN